jgi:hypothetical protein
MYVYEKHTGFRAFTEEMTRLRQEAKLRGDGGGDEFYKLVLNGSYGYDIMNEEKFSKSQVVTKSTTAMKDSLLILCQLDHLMRIIIKFRWRNIHLIARLH